MSEERQVANLLSEVTSCGGTGDAGTARSYFGKRDAECNVEKRKSCYGYIVAVSCKGFQIETQGLKKQHTFSFQPA